ncbi:hypothetical protein ANCCAN_26722, partial [Ancylostoma caninum]
VPGKQSQFEARPIRAASSTTDKPRIAASTSITKDDNRCEIDDDLARTQCQSFKEANRIQNVTQEESIVKTITKVDKTTQSFQDSVLQTAPSSENDMTAMACEN